MTARTPAPDLTNVDSLAADVVQDFDGKWRATIHGYPARRLLWEKGGMRTEHNATTAMEAAWQRLTAAIGAPR